MAKKSAICIGIIITCMLPTISNAITIDVDTYFAYAKVPGVNYSHFYIMLSKQACTGKGAPKGWKVAAYNYRSSWGDESACWVLEDKETVRVCPSGQYTTQFKNNPDSTSVIPCHVWPKRKFIDTSTLPRQADF